MSHEGSYSKNLIINTHSSPQLPVALRPLNLLCLSKKSLAFAALRENKINTVQVFMVSPRKLSINNCCDGPEITYRKLF